jgi:MFS family permease
LLWFSYFWGVLSDKKGRRPTLILSGVGIAIFTFLFGLTNTTTGLAWAMIMRFFSGAANGAVGTAKTVVFDVSDDTNQGKSLVVMTCAFSGGFTVGPALGGALAEPVRQYPDSFQTGTVKTFLVEFPYFLPCFVISILAGIATLFVYFKLPETGKSKHNCGVFHNNPGKNQEPCSDNVLGNDNEDACNPHLVVHYNVQQENVVFDCTSQIQNVKIHEVDGDCTIGDGELISSEDSQQLLESTELEENNVTE